MISPEIAASGTEQHRGMRCGRTDPYPIRIPEDGSNHLN
ncbi:hypothetical protein MicloDRAFT_00061350 [Microvirga lotononidis]|uniref:Uncharacterized protein n=1 Tax=Microvirga lotononidis TaxID=864069 RepID=I4YN67_9HYPH|nr:hypothetical protein MicloDRAFT_00061350 [Microvirga lotononidis]